VVRVRAERLGQWGSSAGGRHRTDGRSDQRLVAAPRVEPTGWPDNPAGTVCTKTSIVGLLFTLDRLPAMGPESAWLQAARAGGGIRVLMTHTITANGGAPEVSPKQMLAESVRARLDGPGPVR
jgi:hypothetical protein